MNLRNRLRNSPEVHTGALNDILFILLLFLICLLSTCNNDYLNVTISNDINLRYPNSRIYEVPNNPNTYLVIDDKVRIVYNSANKTQVVLEVLKDKK